MTDGEGFDYSAYRAAHPKAAEYVDRLLDHPEEAASIERAIAAAARAEGSRGGGDDDDDPGDPGYERAIQRALAPVAKSLELTNRQLAELNAERLERARVEKLKKEREAHEAVVGKIDELIKGDEILGDYPQITDLARGAVLYEAQERGHKSPEDAFKATLPRLRGLADHVAKKIASAKNPGSGKIESGAGSPAGKEAPDRDIATGGFMTGLRDALRAKKTGAMG